MIVRGSFLKWEKAVSWSNRARAPDIYKFSIWNAGPQVVTVFLAGASVSRLDEAKSILKLSTPEKCLWRWQKEDYLPLAASAQRMQRQGSRVAVRLVCRSKRAREGWQHLAHFRRRPDFLFLPKIRFCFKCAEDSLINIFRNDQNKQKEQILSWLPTFLKFWKYFTVLLYCINSATI
jgi:hypothetical protein